jgi:hypothetical protein
VRVACRVGPTNRSRGSKIEVAEGMMSIGLGRGMMRLRGVRKEG